MRQRIVAGIILSLTAATAYAVAISGQGTWETTLQGPDLDGNRATAAAYSDGDSAPTPDNDGDGVADDADNCTLVANADQYDADGDGYGNMCDADLNNSGLVTSADYTILRNAMNTADPVADLNHSGLVTAADATILENRLNQAPGPSGLHP